MRKFMVWAALTLALGGMLPSVLPAYAQDSESIAAEAVDGEETGQRSFEDWYAMGGKIMHLIVLCSMITFGLVLERVWALRQGAVIPRSFLTGIRDHWNRQSLNKALAICTESQSSIARVLRSGLLHFNAGLAGMQDAVETAGAHEATLLRRNLPLLGAIGNIATMLGLLGTVLGMIDSFDQIAKTGTGDARIVAGGIFQALVTTAAGLMVGVTAVGFHALLRRKVEVLETDLEEISMRMLEDVTVQNGNESKEA